MGKNKVKSYPLRLNEEIMGKIRYIAEAEDRKISNQLEKVIKEYIDKYEAEHGTITL